MPDTVTLKKEDLLKAWGKGCDATKKALELLYPGELPPKKIEPETGSVFIGRVTPWPYIVYYEGGKARTLKLPSGEPFPFKGMNLRPMTSGTITLTIEGGQVALAKTKED